MQKLIPLAVIASAFWLQAPAVLAQEPDPQTSNEVEPGDETSDRTPQKETPTPDTQVDETQEGETSDRTPSKHGEDKADDQ